MGGTTPNLTLPYPVGTDRVTDGDNAIEALARRMDTLLGPDTGWVELPCTLGGGTCQYRAKYGHVSIRIGATAATTSGATYLVVAVGGIPAAYRPGGNVRGPCVFGPAPGTMLIVPDGSIAIGQASGAPQSTVEGFATYPVEAKV